MLSSGVPGRRHCPLPATPVGQAVALAPRTALPSPTPPPPPDATHRSQPRRPQRPHRPRRRPQGEGISEEIDVATPGRSCRKKAQDLRPTCLRQIVTIPDVPSHATTSAGTPLSRQVAPACSDASRLSPATIFASMDRSSQRQPFHAAGRAELESLRGHRLPRAICMQRSHSGDLGLAKRIHVHKFLL